MLQTSICETTEGVNSYSGYVKIPKELLRPIANEWEDGAAAHMFFWYFGMFFISLLLQRREVLTYDD